jgi:hypothetical protein
MILWTSERANGCRTFSFTIRSLAVAYVRRAACIQEYLLKSLNSRPAWTVVDCLNGMF